MGLLDEVNNRIKQIPQRADEIHNGLLRAPSDLSYLFSPEFKQKLDEELKKPPKRKKPKKPKAAPKPA